MKNVIHLALGLSILAGCTLRTSQPSAPPSITVTYPVTTQVNVKDNYFGTTVTDPYRWLETPDSQPVTDWVNAQNKVTFDYLEQIPFRTSVRSRLEKLWNFPKFGAPFRCGDKYLFYKNDGLQNQSVLYIRETLDAEPRLLIDPNTLSKDGTTSLAGVYASKDGKYLAYATSAGGSDWNDIYVLETATGKQLEDHISWVKFSGATWEGDGFYYGRYDTPKKGEELSSKNEFQKLYYHKLGTSQDKDILVYEDRQHPLRNFGIGITEDGSYHLLYMSEGATENGALWYRKSGDLKAPFKPLIDNFENEYAVIDNIGDKLLVITNNQAPRKRVVLMDPAHPETSAWTTVIDQQPEVLVNLAIAGEKLITTYMKDASHRLYVHTMDGKRESEITLAALGDVSVLNAKKGDPLVFYSLNSFLVPSTIYKYDVTTGKSEEYLKPEIDFDFSRYETRQVFYQSKDGTKVPMFITCRKDLKKNSQNPTILYGYGGFNISVMPAFRVWVLAFLEQGGVYCQANLRGGSEYGEEWHTSGNLLNKQNVFDDFIAAAEYLIAEKYTSSSKLAISGRSNGGLLVGATMTQRPDLFKVALPGVGVLDMLRYHKFTIGWAWATEYGSSDDSTHFKNLFKYSPLHNIKQGTQYPSTLITTADHDDRVVPAHSYKYAAALQNAQTGPNPVLIRIDTQSGHGAGKPTSKQIDEASDVLSFVLFNVGANWVEP